MSLVEELTLTQNVDYSITGNMHVLKVGDVDHA